MADHKTVIFAIEHDFDPGPEVVTQIQNSMGDLAPRLGFKTATSVEVEYDNGEQMGFFGIGPEPVVVRFAVVVKNGLRDSECGFLETDADEDSDGWRFLREMLGVELTQAVFKF